MNKLLIVAVMGLLLVGCVGYVCLENKKYTEEINEERQDYNLIVEKYILPYKLGDDLLPYKSMKK